MHNERAYKMVEERFSAHVKVFNHYDVSDDDSDTHYWTAKDRLELAQVALERAPEMKVTTLARSLGGIYQAIRKNLTPDELARWNEADDVLENLANKYGM
ncbi:hypothetical protein [Streptomyces flavofungini]|uniref:hypothetical protein n=1 Tax=Streptomyces flavofungini TaxID=68200 RepID=UPI0025B129A5|nr:hypothetical protein [Streptomyces flavofungini]WJV49893.1 hypothetical protein QUY26_32850 [Streptomyces flavofungini]